MGLQHLKGRDQPEQVEHPLLRRRIGVEGEEGHRADAEVQAVPGLTGGREAHGRQRVVWVGARQRLEVQLEPAGRRLAAL